jgi:hypothetical protein
LTVLGGLEFDGWDVTAVLVQAAVVVPIDPLQNRNLDLLGIPKRSPRASNEDCSAPASRS